VNKKHKRYINPKEERKIKEIKKEERKNKE